MDWPEVGSRRHKRLRSRIGGVSMEDEPPDSAGSAMPRIPRLSDGGAFFADGAIAALQDTAVLAVEVVEIRLHFVQGLDHVPHLLAKGAGGSSLGVCLRTGGTP